MIWNIQKGDAPIDHATIERQIEPEMTRRGWPSKDREETLLMLMSDPTSPEAQAALAALAQFKADLANVKAINAFNHELAQYKTAKARLDQVQLSVGRPAIVEIDEEGNEVEVSPAIEALIGGTVEVPVFDQDGNQVGTEEQPDEIQLRINKDEEERAIAQATVDNTKQEVKDF